MDTIEAKKNKDAFKQNIACLDSYNHLNSSYAFKQACQSERKELVKRVQNIEQGLNSTCRE